MWVALALQNMPPKARAPEARMVFGWGQVCGVEICTCSGPSRCLPTVCRFRDRSTVGSTHAPLVWLRPLFCVGSLFSQGETQIWPVVAVAGFFVCRFVFSMDLPRFLKLKGFILFAHYFTASLTVRTEPERDRPQQKKKTLSLWVTYLPLWLR